MIAGIILAIITTFKFYVETKKLNIEISETAPNFEIFFLDAREIVFSELISKTLLSQNENLNNLAIWRYPILKNEVYNIFLSDKAKSKDGAYNFLIAKFYSMLSPGARSVIRINNITHYDRQVVLLVLQQNGKRKAQDVKLEVDYVYPSTLQEIYEDSDLIDDYIDAKIRKTVQLETKLIDLGSLNTGQGLLIPLFCRDIFHLHSKPQKYGIPRDKPVHFWTVAASLFCIPKKIIYYDNFDNKKHEFDVRKMLKTPFSIFAEIEIRG